MSVDHGAGSGVIIGIFLDFLSLKLFCVLSLESPHGGNSNEYTQYTIFNITRKIDLNYLKAAAVGFFPWDSGAGSRRPWWAGRRCSSRWGPAVYCLFIYIMLLYIMYDVSVENKSK